MSKYRYMAEIYKDIHQSDSYLLSRGNPVLVLCSVHHNVLCGHNVAIGVVMRGII